MEGTARKKRKWDVPGPNAAPTLVTPAAASSTPGFLPTPKPTTTTATTASLFGGIKAGQPLDAAAIKRAQAAAAAIASKLSQESAAKGLFVPALKFSPAPDIRAEIFREVVFNDAPSQIRFHLTKRTVQDDIQRRTGTVIVTRGRYYPPGVKVEEHEKPLHLWISAGVESGQTDEARVRAVEAAVTEVQRVMHGDASYQHGTLAEEDPAQASGPCHQVVYIGFEAPPEFGLANRLRGQGDSFLQHIAMQTRATVVLRGRGSFNAEGPEPLHIFISAPNARAVEEARSLAVDLVATVRRDFEAAYPAFNAAFRPPSTYAHSLSLPPPFPAASPPPFPMLMPHQPNQPHGMVPPQFPNQNPYSSSGFGLPQHASQPFYPPPMGPSSGAHSAMPHPAHPPPFQLPMPHSISGGTAHHQQQYTSQSPVHSAIPRPPIKLVTAIPEPAAATQQGIIEIEKASHPMLTEPAIPNENTNLSQGKSAADNPKPRSPKRKFREFKETKDNNKKIEQGFPSVNEISPNSNSTSLYAKQYATAKVPMGPPPPKFLAKPPNKVVSTAPDVGGDNAEGSVKANAGVTGVLTGLVDYEGED